MPPPRRTARGNLKADLGSRTGRWIERAAMSHGAQTLSPNRRHLEGSIGYEVRRQREALNLTISKLANAAGMSTGMLSKIENGTTSPSLSSLRALAEALQVPITTLFMSYEGGSEATFVEQGRGLEIERRGSGSGHRYLSLGHGHRGTVLVESYMVEFSAHSSEFTLFQHPGLEFFYILGGELVYRHGTRSYRMKEGDSLFFEGDTPHGPEEFVQVPIRMICIICSPTGNA
ncbi:MAG: XRE family transcriptional regulator [Alphaproteobacteria bacterium]|nr:XRE family transcriptional regulator [Alphaproteobacteria bacterium]MDA8004579.1 XRE family transcriptional regulator [Alphaproteobacteria bacterium]MDA8006212.1 XRE family transcriptional regulator [Alphaproteobacteria bacterium]MDA8012997.1 XRE family transcriptional regulator [Alphaproteobacteria bacterium]